MELKAPFCLMDLTEFLGKPIWVRYTRPRITGDEEYTAIGYFNKGSYGSIQLQFHPQPEGFHSLGYLPPHITVGYEDILEVKECYY